jgi:hypothetical protein
LTFVDIPFVISAQILTATLTAVAKATTVFEVRFYVASWPLRRGIAPVKGSQWMSQSLFGNSVATKNLKDLLSRIYDVSVRKDSLFERAQHYFSGIDQAELDALQQQTDALEQKLSIAGNKASAKVEAKLAEIRQQLKDKQQQLDVLRVDRVQQLKQVARLLLELSQGATLQETQILSARALGTIQLLSPSHGKQIAAINLRHRHAYKAILALLLLDRLLAVNLIKNRYVLQKWHDSQQAKQQDSTTSLDPFREDVQLPLVMALLLQDIGLQHPAAQLILKGEAGELDESRILTPPERQALLQISYQQSQDFLAIGLGTDRYIGNSKAERALHQEIEQERLKFISHLLTSAIQPAEGIGNLLKIPQTYVSVVLPCKQNYKYEQLPKVSAILKAGVGKGWYPAPIVDALLEITGAFPQGYGITYIPKDSDNKDLDRYEYAIVNGLYPVNFEQPHCRAVTRNLTYHSSGNNVIIGSGNNLYFAPAQQKLEKMSEERLQEILSKLASNFTERSQMDLIPKCWHPDEYFTYLKNQNLWNKTDTYRN